MTMKSHTCPECGQPFHCRKRNCCPHCGIELVLGKKGYITARDHGDSQAVYDAFAQHMKKLGIEFWQPRGSSARIAEQGFALGLISEAALYIGHCGKKGRLDPTDFTLRVLDEIFADRGTAAWIAEAPTLRKCNSGTFHRVAPVVLKRLERQGKEDTANGQRLSNVSMDGVDVQYAL